MGMDLTLRVGAKEYDLPRDYEMLSCFDRSIFLDFYKDGTLPEPRVITKPIECDGAETDPYGSRLTYINSADIKKILAAYCDELKAEKTEDSETWLKVLGALQKFGLDEQIVLYWC